MDAKFNELKSTFNGIKNIREEINNIFANLEQRVLKLKELYKDFIDHNTTTLFIFGLDSFYFQNKLIDIEFSDMKKFYDLIMNRMYCEYYKLYKIILDYCYNNLSDDSKFIDSIRSKTEYPVYKDLEPYKRYDFLLIDELHEDITNTLIASNNYLINKKNILESYRLRSNVGLNINNFVSTYEFEVTTIDSQIALFCSYVDFFHELHLKYLKRFITKIQILYGQVNHDIKFDEVSLNKKSDKKKYMNEMKNELDKKTMRAIRSSIQIDKEKEDGSSDSEDSKEDIEVKQVNERIKSVLDISNNLQKNISPVSGVPDKDIPFMILPINDLVATDKPIESIENPILDTVEKTLSSPNSDSNNEIVQEPVKSLIQVFEKESSSGSDIESIQRRDSTPSPVSVKEQESIKEPVETQEEEPLQESVQEPVETQEEEPVETQEEEPVQESVQEPAQEPVQDPVQENIDTIPEPPSEKSNDEDDEWLSGFVPANNKKNKNKKNKKKK